VPTTLAYVALSCTNPKHINGVPRAFLIISMQRNGELNAGSRIKLSNYTLLTSRSFSKSNIHCTLKEVNGLYTSQRVDRRRVIFSKVRKLLHRTIDISEQ